MSKEEVRLNIPNLISLARIICVPIMVWLILNGEMMYAFWLFVAAGISDALDGFVAKRFNLETELGGFLDPIADKALLLGVFITLGQAGYIETWLVILVVFRDALILCGAFLYQLLYQNLVMQPLMSSKINTTAQFVYAAVVLGMMGYKVEDGIVLETLFFAVVATTVWSGASYVIIWGRRAVSMEPGE